jgi:hypothetical protein
MQRDMDLIREILQYIVKNEKLSSIPNREKEEVVYHLDLIYDAGFLLNPLENFTRISQSLRLEYEHRLSWKGQEYYAAIQDKRIWDKIPKEVKMAPLEIIKGVAVELIKAQFNP